MDVDWMGVLQAVSLLYGIPGFLGIVKEEVPQIQN